MGKGRLEAFSDGVFSIAITLLILTVAAPTDTHDLGRRLTRLWPSYAAYGASFLLVGQVWLNHHALFARIRHTDSTLAVINLLLLMDVSILPFPTEVLAAAFHDNTGQRLAVVAYGLTLFAGGVLFNATWRYAVHRHLTEPDLTRQQIKSISRRFLIGPTSYLAAATIGLGAPTVALILYIVLIVFYLVPGPQHRPVPADRAAADPE